MTREVPAELQIFMNHIYELKKGVRYMALLTMGCQYRDFAVRRLENNGISYLVQEVSERKINLFFGKAECMDVIRRIVIRPSFLARCWGTTSARHVSASATVNPRRRRPKKGMG